MGACYKWVYSSYSIKVALNLKADRIISICGGFAIDLGNALAYDSD